MKLDKLDYPCMLVKKGNRTAQNIFSYLRDQGYEVIKPKTDIHDMGDANDFFSDLKDGDIVFHYSGYEGEKE